MTKTLPLFILPFLALLMPLQAAATPDCYRDAKNPAHELPFMDKSAAAVTALNPDGENCHEVRLHNGEPLMAQKLYVPMRDLYEAYVRALENGDMNAARRAYAWLKPTPRQFPKWLWLANEAVGPPMPWGMGMAINVLRLLQPEKAMEKDLLQRGDSAMPALDMEAYWPILYLLMGGEVLPQDNPDAWTESKIHASRARWMLSWHSPWAFIEEASGDGKKILLRMR